MVMKVAFTDAADFFKEDRKLTNNETFRFIKDTYNEEKYALDALMGCIEELNREIHEIQEKEELVSLGKGMELVKKYQSYDTYLKKLNPLIGLLSFGIKLFESEISDRMRKMDREGNYLEYSRACAYQIAAIQKLCILRSWKDHVYPVYQEGLKRLHITWSGTFCGERSKSCLSIVLFKVEIHHLPQFSKTLPGSPKYYEDLFSKLIEEALSTPQCISSYQFPQRPLKDISDT